MTYEQRIDMYKHKKLFVDSISKVFELEELYSNVIKIQYTVLTKYSFSLERDVYFEFVVVTFDSGAQSVRHVSGTSNNGIFVEIGKLINGGYYDEIPFFNDLINEGTFLKL